MQYLKESYTILHSTSTDSPIQNLPTDVIQHILSFQIPELPSAKCVSKDWNKAAEQTERSHYIKLQRKLDENSPFSYDDNSNSTWIVHPKIRPLTNVERELGYQGPVRCMDELYHTWHQVDRIFIHDGIYHIQDSHWNDGETSIISVNKNSIFFNSNEFGDYFMSVNNFNMYFESITIDCSKCKGGCESAFWIRNGKVHLNECTLELGRCGVEVGKSGELIVENCKFNGGTSAIQISPDAKMVTVRNSIFRHCGRMDHGKWCNEGENACVLMTNKNETDNHPTVKLVCDGNIFEDNMCYPIAERARGEYVNDIEYPSQSPRYVNKAELYRIENNILKGYNASKVKKQSNIVNANKMYYNDEDFRPDWESDYY